MTPENQRLGVILMIATTFVFATQDSISRHLAGQYNVLVVVMIRYWFFAAFVVALGARSAGGVGAMAATKRPVLQAIRGLLLAAEVCVMVYAFTLLGLVESHAVFAAYPLLVAALSGPVLGERVGWRRWSAIAIGFVGVMIILQPGIGVFSRRALVPLASATLFALYNLLTRFAAGHDSAATSYFWTGAAGALTRFAGGHDSAATSYFWTGAAGALAMTVVGVWFWQPMTAPDWGWMGLLCLLAALGHWLLIKCYEIAEASAVQPFAYLQLVFASAYGLALFGETLRINVVIGAGLVILYQQP